MSGSVEVVLWINEYEHKALERQLALDSSNIEKTMQEMLMELYSQRVPVEEQKAIRDRIDAEHAEQVAEQLANTTWAAYHVIGQGEDIYFKTSAADTLLIAAKRLRTYLTKNDTPQSGSFAAVFKDRLEITKEEYAQLLGQRLENTGTVSGLFEVDFDKEIFSAVSTMDGWHTFRLHDVSVAAYHAFRKQNISTDQRWDRLLDKLDGKELTPDSETTVLFGSRRLSIEKITFQDEISECGSLLNFYVPVTFDPDAVFGTHVDTEENDDFLNVYADFDLDTGEVCDALTVIYVYGDGSEEAYRYPLDKEERAALGAKMDAYCMEQTGMHLDKYRAQYLTEMDGSAQEQTM